VSNIYKHLQTHFSGNSLDIKEKWELEINVVIEDEEWEVVCGQGHKIPHSPVWKEFNWKLKMRYFKTPSSISKYDKNNSKLCWRKCKPDTDSILARDPNGNSITESITLYTGLDSRERYREEESLIITDSLTCG